MTLDQLRAFDAVVKYGTVRAASQHIFKSAPSISLSIKSLEEHIGVKLFSRTGYRLVLTEDGELLYRKTQEILFNVTEFGSLIKNKNVSSYKRLSFALCPYTPLAVQKAIALVMKNHYPNTDLAFTTIRDQSPSEMLHESDVDFIFTSNLEGIDSGMKCKSVIEATLLPVAVSQSIADRKSRITLKGISGPLGATRSSICVENTATLKALLHAEMGWSIVPEELVETELNDSSLVRVKPHVPWVDRVEYFVISKRDCTKRKILDALAALLFEDLGVLAPYKI